MNASIAEAGTHPEDRLRPVQLSQRIAIIDVLRGVAIFGILMVNMHYFAHPWMAPHLTPDSSSLDVGVNWVLNVFFVTKFFSLFSFLFGLGMALQMQRAEAKGIAFVPFYARRLVLLMLFGLAHAILLWIGDILFVYSIVGFLLLFFWRKARPKTLVVWACVLVSLLLLVYTFSVVSLTFARSTPEGVAMLDEMSAEMVAQMEADLARDSQVYATGTFVEITRERAVDFADAMWQANLWLMPSILGMFLLGFVFGKRRIFENLDEHRPFLRRLFLILFPIGLVANLIWAALGYDMTSGAFGLAPGFLLGMMVLAIGGPPLTLSYVAGLTLLSTNGKAARFLSIFAPVGRMALTNYLTHSLVMTTIFYGYGLGLLGSVGVAGGVLMGIVLYALQIPFSHWWLSRYRFGPFEWLWRSLTYGQFQPMRRGVQTA